MPQQPDTPTKSVTVTVHVCPTPGCDNYHGSSSYTSTPEKHFSGPMVENRFKQLQDTGSREKKSLADCPACFANNKRVQRVPITTHVIVPLLQPGDEPVPLPAG